MHAHPPLIHLNMLTHVYHKQQMRGGSPSISEDHTVFFCVHPRQTITQEKVHCTIGEKYVSITPLVSRSINIIDRSINFTNAIFSTKKNCNTLYVHIKESLLYMYVHVNMYVCTYVCVHMDNEVKGSNLVSS